MNKQLSPEETLALLSRIEEFRARNPVPTIRATKTVGNNKYNPQTCNRSGESKRRLKAMQRQEAKNKTGVWNIKD